MTAPAAPLALTDQVVIVGAGLAGFRVVEGARHAGFAGPIVLVGDEPHPPYDRPPLSKQVLLSEGHEHTIGLAPNGDYSSLNVDLKLGRAAVAIDRTARFLVLADGERIPYARLVLATGSRVRTLPALPRDPPRVFYLRALDDAITLRTALTAAKRVVIVGAGVIGLEIAAAASVGGHAVTVIEAQPRVMARTAAPVVSSYFERRHRAAGVDFRFGVTVTESNTAGGAMQILLSDGEVLAADVVVVGIGVLPNSELASACGLEVRQGGIVVDGHGRTSDACIYAAGEVAMHYNSYYGRHDRQETWAHAAAHGQHVGRSLVTPDTAYAEVSSFWTDQYDINLQVVGAPMGETDVMRGAPDSGKFLVFHLTAGAVAGVSSVNSVRELRVAKKLIGRAAPVDARALADPAAPLSELV